MYRLLRVSRRLQGGTITPLRQKKTDYPRMSIPQAEEQEENPEASGFVERRAGTPDRRTTQEDRRNMERVAQDIAPRRDPEVKDRRKSR